MHFRSAGKAANNYFEVCRSYQHYSVGCYYFNQAYVTSGFCSQLGLRLLVSAFFVVTAGCSGSSTNRSGRLYDAGVCVLLDERWAGNKSNGEMKQRVQKCIRCCRKPRGQDFTPSVTLTSTAPQLSWPPGCPDKNGQSAAQPTTTRENIRLCVGLSNGNWMQKLRTPSPLAPSGTGIS